MVGLAKAKSSRHLYGRQVRLAPGRGLQRSQLRPDDWRAVPTFLRALCTPSLLIVPTVTVPSMYTFVHCCAGNAFMSELQSRLVPLLVEKEEFWARYFYR